MAQIELSGISAGHGSTSGHLNSRLAFGGSISGIGTLRSGPKSRVFMHVDGILGEIFFVDERGVLVPMDVSTLTDGRIPVWRSALKKWVVEPPALSAIPTTIRDAWVPLIIGDGVTALTAGLYPGSIYLPQGQIIDVRLWGKEASGSVDLDIWGDLFANVPPTVADSIANGNRMVISAARKVEKNQAQLTTDGWLVNVPVGGYFAYVNLVTVAAFTQLFLLLQVRRG